LSAGDAKNNNRASDSKGRKVFKDLMAESFFTNLRGSPNTITAFDAKESAEKPCVLLTTPSTISKEEK